MAAVCQQNCTKQPEGTNESGPTSFWKDSPKWERIVRNLDFAQPSPNSVREDSLSHCASNIKSLAQRAKLNVIPTLFLCEKEYIVDF